MKSLSDFENARKLAHPDQKFGCVTFAQHGDDIMIVNLFLLMGIQKPSYLDLGAHHPFIISNTAMLYERGSRGVNVEANPNLMKTFELYRPEDTNVNVGVGLQEGVSPFYMFSDTSGRNTFSNAEAKTFEKVMPVRRVINLPVLTIDQIVERYCGGIYPDLLLTDLEGLDYAVLKSANFEKTSPKVIVTEVRRTDACYIKLLMMERGYFVYCRMGENLFFVRDDFKTMVF